MKIETYRNWQKLPKFPSVQLIIQACSVGVATESNTVTDYVSSSAYDVPYLVAITEVKHPIYMWVKIHQLHLMVTSHMMPIT